MTKLNRIILRGRLNVLDLAKKAEHNVPGASRSENTDTTIDTLGVGKDRHIARMQSFQLGL